MTRYSTNEFKNGLKIMQDGAPCTLVDTEFVKPGKGQAFARVKFRNLLTNRVGEKTFKSGESVDGADVMEVEYQFLYRDSDVWHFMNPKSYEQLEVNTSVVDEAAKWLKEQDICILTLWNGEAIVVTPPNFAQLEITETDPGVRGDTAQGGSKPATLETGAVVKIPLFVQQGEVIKIDTRTGEYVSRAKD